MGLKRKDRVKDTTTTTGTGTITLGGTAPTGFKSFASALTDGDTVRYLIIAGAEWEHGEGVWTASGSTLTRATIFASSNSDAAVNFSAGSKDVSIVAGARDFEELVGIGTIKASATRTAPLGHLLCDGSAVSRTTYDLLFAAIVPSLGTMTVTIAAPGVVTLNSHGLLTGDQIYITTTGALPTGLSANTIYWVTKVDANTFKLATSLANAKSSTNITTTGSQSGVHTLRHCPFGLGDGSTTFNVPNIKGKMIIGLDASDVNFNLLNVPDTYVGEKTHTLTTNEMPSHTHTQDSHNHTQNSHFHTIGVGPGDQDGSGSNGWITGSSNTSTVTATNIATTATNQNTGGGAAHNIINPYIILNYVIKY